MVQFNASESSDIETEGQMSSINVGNGSNTTVILENGQLKLVQNLLENITTLMESARN